jgi:glycosyltransferase involved in cell wall biosynthesis
MSPDSTTSPTVSIVIGARNAATTLSATLDSVLAQSMADWECIVVDDGSTDETGGIIRDFATRDPRVRFITLETNAGLTRALKRGVDEARGLWLARIDAGDTWHPAKLARQLAYCAEHPDTGLIGCWSEDTNRQTGAVVVKQKPVEHDAIASALPRFCPFIHSTIVVRLDCLRACGGYDPAFPYAQDYDLYFRLLEYTRGHNLPEPLCQRSTHEFSAISYARWKPQLRCSLAIRWKYHRLHRRPWHELMHLVPDMLRLIVPASFKGLKQRLGSQRHARQA